MIAYRPFLNSDPPYLSEIWRTQSPERGLMQPMSVDLWDSLVFAKPYFDRNGLIVAVDGERPVGFAHASFGPSDDGYDVSTDLGVTSLVMVRANYQRRGIGCELIARSEEYLRSRGAKMLYAGGIKPLNGFYLGLYGGSELPGVLESTPRAQQLFRSVGYEEIDRVIVFQRELATFRPTVDRKQLTLRRRFCVRYQSDPPARDWWEANTFGPFDRLRFELTSNETKAAVGSATFWNMQSLSASWGVHAVGMIDVEIADCERRQGLATFLIGESLKHLGELGFSLVEVQTMQHNAPARALYNKLGFRQVDTGSVLRKG
ncbi:MAG: GNAT family N-acetyltransferase [Planctomycetes bacterium]|nr:GNAT family N-acetyltransferase [Planctomycetota bacterium]